MTEHLFSYGILQKKIQLTVIARNNHNEGIEGTALKVTEEELLFADKYKPDNYKELR